MVFSSEKTDRYDWRLLHWGAVNLYWRMEIFESDIAELVELNYRIIRLRFDNASQFQNDLSAALKWREQFGYFPWTGNLNALNDGFKCEPLESADDNAICIENYNALVRDDEQLSVELLNMIEYHSRNYLLLGKRLIGLVQTNDPAFYCRNIGGRRANWNQAEWLNSARGL